MQDITLRRRIPVGNLLGESILWDNLRRKILWTDMPGRTLFVLEEDADTPRQYSMPEDLCSFALIDSSDELLGAFASGVAIFEPGKPPHRWLFRLPEGAALRLNDGRTDRSGRFWVGSLVDRDDNQPTETRYGELYCVDHDGSINSHAKSIGIANGLAWSPDGRTQYFADSVRREIYAFSANPETGTIANRRLFATTPEGTAPDGATVDADGGLWSAQWGGGCVVRYGPDGRVDCTVNIPVANVTCVAFVGPELDQLAVTTARFGLDDKDQRDQPYAGDVFVFDTPYRGLAEPRFYRGANFAAT